MSPNDLDDTEIIKLGNNLVFQFTVEKRDIYILAIINMDETIYIGESDFPFTKEETTQIELEIAKQYFKLH